MMEERHKHSKGKIMLNASLRNEQLRTSIEKKNYLKSLMLIESYKKEDGSRNDDYAMMHNNFTVGADLGRLAS